MSKTYKQKLRVIKENFASSNGDFFIYQVAPLQPIHIKRHPKYRTYSIIHTSALFLDEEYECELEETINSRTGAIEYRVKKVFFNFPENPLEQWMFFQRYCNNNSAKRLFSKIQEFVSMDQPILDLIQDESFKEKLLQDLVPSGLHIKAEHIMNRLIESQAVARFISSLPANIADELTDHQAQALSKLQPKHNLGFL